MGRDWRPFVYGGLASVTAECGTFPMDTTKTRLQIQGQQIDAKYSTIKYNGMLHAIQRISKEEGFRALYNGIAPAVLRQATYGTIKIGVYYTAKKYLMQNREEESLSINVMCAVFAGVVSASLANPTDVLKIRMQAQCEGFVHKSMPQCFTDIYKLEGIRGLWRGVGSTAQRAAIIVGIELPVYDVAKRYLTPSLGDTVGNHLLSSFIAGLAGSIGSNPIDVIRTRLMNQRRVISGPGSSVNIYNGALDCLVKTVKSEGFTALYKGFIPTWFRLGPWNIIFFVTYEQLKKVY